MFEMSGNYIKIRELTKILLEKCEVFDSLRGILYDKSTNEGSY